MARRGWSEAELGQQRKAAAEKIRITRKLRAETTMAWGWIAERLAMGISGCQGRFEKGAKRAVWKWIFFA